MKDEVSSLESGGVGEKSYAEVAPGWQEPQFWQNEGRGPSENQKETAALRKSGRQDSKLSER